MVTQWLYFFFYDNHKPITFFVGVNYARNDYTMYEQDRVVRKWLFVHSLKNFCEISLR